MLAPRQAASPHFDSLKPSMLRGPYSGRNYSITACPMNGPDAHGRRFTVDDMLDQAFKTGSSTVVSLTDRRDVPHSRHSDYYKQNKADGKYSITTHGRPSYTTTVNSNGQPVSLSIYKNTVQNRQTGQVAHMNMVHVDGWRDQTTVDAGALLELQTKLRSKLNRSDLQNMLIHCSEGRNRSAEFLTGLEGISNVSHGQAPNVAVTLDAFRQARVADAMFVPSQLKAAGEMQVRLERMVNGQANRAG